MDDLKNPLKIVFVGGHHTPALAVMASLAAKLKTAGKPYKFYWIGHKYSMWGDKKESAEYREVTALNIPFYDLKAGKLYRTYHPLKLLRLPLGFLQALLYIRRLSPQLTVSFGGYLAVPVALVSWFRRIPVFTHEQAVSPGLANRIIAHFARKVLISFPESQQYFPKNKSVLTGNPLRKEIFEVNQPISFPLDREKYPTIYITGGKQGGHTINRTVGEILPELLSHFNIIHQCGSSTVYGDFQYLELEAGKLPDSLSDGYILKDYFAASQVGSVFAKADFVLSRSGANIVSELAALGKPAVLIPIPWSSGNEQENNAKVLVKAGLAVILPQTELSGERLLKTCLEFSGRLKEFIPERATRAPVELSAAEIIATELFMAIR
ncbi:MAG: UDP-N-acetylglucosamine--N-acetylmuramyl-(pentapeptide) pyrophosphoryl-undecaprenol N-acetylglucosamine transferase [Patescibacteria group bacterium]